MSADNPNVSHPQHYGGKDNPYEAIKIIRALDLGFSRGNALKYLVRAGKKLLPNGTGMLRDQEIEDLEKAIWYIQEEIDFLKTCIGKDLPIGKEKDKP